MKIGLSSQYWTQARKRMMLDDKYLKQIKYQ